MLKKLYANPASIICISVLVLVAGVIQFMGLPVALYPDASRPVLAVRLSPDTVNPEDFRSQYGTEIEGKLKGLKGVEKVEGYYSNSRVKWDITFSWDADKDKLDSEIRSALATFEGRFPRDWGRFRYFFDSNSSARIFMAASSEKYSDEELWALLREKVKTELESIHGMDSAFVMRPFDTLVNIELDYGKMLEADVGADEIESVLKEHEYDVTLPRMRSRGGTQFPLLIPRKEDSVESVKNLVIKKNGIRSVRMGDIAVVELAHKPPERFFKDNGKRALLIGGFIGSEGNIAEAATKFESILRRQGKSIDPDMDFQVLTNPAEFIQEAVQNIGESVLNGILIATLVLFLFLSSVRFTLVIALSIPLSLMGGFIIMSAAGIELNLISLGAMALAVGMVVDGAIVVLENCHRHINLHEPSSRMERVNVIYNAVMEVKTAVIASLLTTIIVFAPLAFTSPLANAVLGDLAKVMVCVLVISVIVTLLVVPPFLVLLKSSAVGKSGLFYALPAIFARFILLMESLYVKTLRLLMGYRWATMSWFAVIFLAIGGAWYLLTFQVKREILATPDTDKVWLIVEFPNQDFEIEESEKLLASVENVLNDEFSSYLKSFMTEVEKDRGFILCSLRDKSQVKEFKKRAEERFVNTPTRHFYVSPWNPTSLEIPEPLVMNVKIGGSDADAKRETLEFIEEIARKDERIGRVNTLPGTKKNNDYEIQYREEVVSHIEQNTGFERGKLNSLLAYALNDKTVKSINLPGEPDPLDVRMGFPEYSLEGPNDLKNFMVRVDDRIIPLRHLARLVANGKWGRQYTLDGQESYRVEISVKESFKNEIAQVRAELHKRLEEDKNIDMSLLSFEDPDEEVNENILSLVLALGLALALIWIVISLQFGSVWQTFIIMCAIPLGFIGVSASLFIFKSTLSVNSMLGLILLCGTAVNNSIIFVDFYNHLRDKFPEKGMSEILEETARLRFRPILITTATTILGMFPIALGFGSGGEILQPLGIAVCGGLGLSTFLTLLTVPLILSLRQKEVEFF